MKRLSPLAVVVACLLMLAGCGGGHHHATTTSSTTTGGAASSHQRVYHTPYGPSAHSPTFGLPPAGFKVSPPATTSPTLEMFDTVTLSTLPADPTLLAGYTAGFWPTYLPLVHAYPHAVVKSIAIHWSYRAQCMDIEPGDASPDEAGAWVRADIAAGFAKPCLYANLSTMPAVRANLAAHGIARSQVLLWDADWTQRAHIDAGYDATQWTEHAFGRNLDESTVSLAFAGIKPTPAVDPRHWTWLPNIVRHFGRDHARERNTVRTWDRARCARPVKRAVCKSSERHLQLLEARVNAIAHRPRPRHARWGALHYRAADGHRTTLGGANRQLRARTHGRGVVTSW